MRKLWNYLQLGTVQQGCLLDWFLPTKVYMLIFVQETKSKIEELQQKLKESKEECEKVRQESQTVIKTYQVSLVILPFNCILWILLLLVFSRMIRLSWKHFYYSLYPLSVPTSFYQMSQVMDSITKELQLKETEEQLQNHRMEQTEQMEVGCSAHHLASDFIFMKTCHFLQSPWQDVTKGINFYS